MSSETTRRLSAILRTAAATLALPLDAEQVERLAAELAPAVKAMLAEADATIAELEPIAYEVTEYAGCTIRTGLDVDLDSPAAVLADRLRGSQHDVVATDVSGPDVLGLTVRPQSLDCWRWWVQRMGVDPAALTTEGSAAVGTGSCQGVTVHLRGEGVPELLADRGAARLMGLIAGTAQL